MPTSENKHVLVIGARGVLGELVVSAFQGAGWTVRPAARRPARDEVLVDLDQPATIAAAVSNEELVINTVPDPGLAVERMVLAQGARRSTSPRFQPRRAERCARLPGTRGEQ